MRRAWYSAGVLILLAGGVAAADGGRIDPAWREKARTDGRAAYDRYAALSARVEDAYEMRTEPLPGPSPSGPPVNRANRMRTAIARAGGNTILEQTRWFDAPPGVQTQLRCENTRYSFTLGRKTADGPYALEGYKEGRQTLLEQTAAGLLSEAYEPLGQALNGIDGKDRYALKAVYWDDARNLLRIDSVSGNADNDTSTQELWVDPAHHWRVVEYHRETKAARFVTEVTYGESVDGLPVPSGFRLVSRYKGQYANLNSVTTGRSEGVWVSAKTDADFTLTAFGLPEPVGIDPPPKPTPRYVWFLLAAGVLVAAAVGFRSLARRAGKARPAAQPAGEA